MSIGPGTQKLTLDSLSPAVEPDSVRIAGSMPGIRLVDVQVSTNFAEVADPRIETLRSQLAEARAALGLAQARVAQATTRTRFINEFAMSSAQRLGRRSQDPLAVEDSRRIGNALESDLAEVDTRLVSLRAEESIATERVAAAEAALAGAQPVGTYHTQIELTLEANPETGTECAGTLELSYVVSGAGWHPVHDVALTDGAVSIRSFGMVTQTTGETWESVELTVSTAEPWRGTEIPEPQPWIIRRHRPQPAVPMAAPMVRARGGQPALMAKAAGAAEMAFDADSAVYEPMVEEGAAMSRLEGSTEYRVETPASIPPDGTSRRVYLGEGEFDAEIDRVATVYLTNEVALRASVTNRSDLVLMAGEASIFHEDRFVGRTFIDALAPGERAELALGVDESIRIERKLTRKDASKSLVGSTRNTATTYTTEISNHGTQRAALVIRDRAPHSADAEIGVKIDQLRPAGPEPDHLGQIEWKLGLDPGERVSVELGWVISHAKDVQVIGLE